MQSDFHLVLAQITEVNYISSYMYGPDDDDFIVLDNGAAEGNMVGMGELLQRAVAYAADEIVLPDVIGNAEATINLVKDAMYQWRNHPVGAQVPVRAMAVVQSSGASSEWQECIKAFEKIDAIKTLGIPRHFLDKDKWMRHQVVSWIKGMGLDERFEVHLLGTNPKWCTEVSFMAKNHPWIRSVDSSLPYNYAIAGVPLTDTMNRSIPISRVKDYFTKERTYDQNQRALVIDNINTFMRWASGTEGARS
jgi:hypothetical protein